MSDQNILLTKLAIFYGERDWDLFHSPKNLCMDLASEVGELIEHSRWLTEKQSSELKEPERSEVIDELGDVFLVLLTLCAKLGVDPVQAATQKLDKIGKKYPLKNAKARR